MQPRDYICDGRQTSHFGQEIDFWITLKGNLSAEKGWEPDWKRYRDPFLSAGLARWPEASSFGTTKGPPSEARCATQGQHVLLLAAVTGLKAQHGPGMLPPAPCCHPHRSPGAWQNLALMLQEAALPLPLLG